MSKLDALLLELEKKDKERSRGKWTHDGDKSFGIQVPLTRNGSRTIATFFVYSEGQADADRQFTIEAVNSNAILREIIRVQTETLKKLTSPLTEKQMNDENSLRLYPEFVVQPMAREALEKVEKLCEK